jgi:hypothetical protein
MSRTPNTCSAELRERTVRWGLDSQGQPGSRCQAVLSINCTERLADPGIEPSVGSVGDSQDTALAKRINGLFKAEVSHRRGPWRSFDCADYAPLERVEWFNNRRLPGPIGNIPPAEAEAKFYAALTPEAMAA